LGVNRVTLGIQSLNDRVLKENNRLFQDKKTSLKLINDTKKTGIKIVNVDLMCGLPGDNINSFKNGLKKIIALKPEIIHINPFFPSSETNFFKKGERYSQEDTLRRTKEAKIGSRLLLDAGYNKAEGAFLGFCRFPEAANQQEIDRIVHSSSFISFGPSAESHAFARLDYTNAYFEKRWDKITLPKYIGIKFDIKEEMKKHIITNLRHTILREKFRNLFGNDIVESFRKELQELKRYNLVYIDAEKIFFKIKTRQEQLILAKHFFNHKYLNNIQKKFGIRFQKNKNYFKEISNLIDITV
jgi:coproporphyrinogen III oxidase-like Fe-S oxidoreductase